MIYFVFLIHAAAYALADELPESFAGAVAAALGTESDRIILKDYYFSPENYAKISAAPNCPFEAGRLAIEDIGPRELKTGGIGAALVIKADNTSDSGKQRLAEMAKETSKSPVFLMESGTLTKIA